MKYIIGMLLLCFLSGCSIISDNVDMTPVAAEYLYNSFDSLDNLDPNLWHFEVLDQSRVTFSSTQYTEGDASLQITVKDGDWVNKGERAELVLKNSDPVNQIVWYRWSFLIPETFEDATSLSQWILIAQWHDQPENGNWENYPGNPPMVGLYYGNDPEKGSGIQFAYGRESKGYEGYKFSNPFFITKGKWYTVTANIYWSTNSQGFGNFWIWDGDVNHQLLPQDGSQNFIGPNMYNTAPAYLKLGIYRDFNISSTNSIFLDRFERAGREEELKGLW